jgi:hypothetical protein
MEHPNHLMNDIPKDVDWKLFTLLMYDMIDTLADKSGKVIVNMNPHEVQLPKKDNLQLAAIISELQIKSVTQISNQARKSLDSGSESEGSSSDNGKHSSHHTNRTDTQVYY